VNKTVLLVDDNRLARMMLSSVIAEARSKWSVVEVHNAEDALEQIEAKTGNFDVILVDVGLPGMDGLELVSRIRKNNQTTAIAVITANIQTPVRERAEAMGATFIEKPLKAQALFEFFEKVDGRE